MAFKRKIFPKPIVFKIVLNVEKLNPHIIKAEYAVRGPIVELAQKLELQGRDMVYFNIGNPQALGQQPLTHPREVLSLLSIPKLLDNNNFTKNMGFASDSIEKARYIRNLNPVGLGAYSQSAGIPFIREAIAEFISNRDNIPSSSDTIFLTDGASKGVDLVLNAIITKNVGIMIPIPQYPLYSADITLFGGHQVPYYLDEENDWEINESMLDHSYQKAQDQGIDVNAIVIINPNNPTGSVLTKKNIKMVLQFAEQRSLTVIADEVYQENIYDEKLGFHSFAKIGTESDFSLPIFSLHSTSKGFIGECGYRGGYLESRNVSKDVMQHLLKVRSISLCSNTPGQIMTYLMVKPPHKGDASYSSYQMEKENILKSMAGKAKLIASRLDEVEGIECPTPKGAMYLFPRLEFPSNKNYNGKPADFRFCERLVYDAGIVTIPGSGFGQRKGTWHLRMTFLPPEASINSILDGFVRVYENFSS